MDKKIVRVKAQHKKVKTGCLTCRKRRVKCDETKPLCVKCVSGGYQCSGYSVLRGSTVICAAPPSSFRGSKEHQGFQFFVENTLDWFEFPPDHPHRQNCSGIAFWNPFVFQMSTQIEGIKHLLLAIASSHSRLLYDNVGELSSEAFMIENVFKATRSLSREPNFDTSIALVTTIMFIILEIMQKNFDVARRHLDSSLKILAQYDARPKAPEGRLERMRIDEKSRPPIEAFQKNMDGIEKFQIMSTKDHPINRIDMMIKLQKKAIPRTHNSVQALPVR